MSTQRHPEVYLCKETQGINAVAAEFEKCCLSTLGCREARVDVAFRYQNERLEIYPSASGRRLEHPSGCPCRFLTPSDISSIPSSSKSNGVNCAVATLLQSSDGHVLLTRRAPHMRTFPSVWVAPGGHVEGGETSLQQTCLRELKEETGLDISVESSTTLGLWESVYPPVLSLGLPQRHHIVVYYLVQSREDHQTLQQKLNLQPQEVDAAMWLDQYMATEVSSSDDYGQSMKNSTKYFSALVMEDGRMQQKNLPLSILMTTLPPPGTSVDIERLSSGTKFALCQWLKLLHPSPAGSL